MLSLFCFCGAFSGVLLVQFSICKLLYSSSRCSCCSRPLCCHSAVFAVFMLFMLLQFCNLSCPLAGIIAVGWRSWRFYCGGLEVGKGSLLVVLFVSSLSLYFVLSFVCVLFDVVLLLFFLLLLCFNLYWNLGLTPLFIYQFGFSTQKK